MCGCVECDGVKLHLLTESEERPLRCQRQVTKIITKTYVIIKMTYKPRQLGFGQFV